MPIVSWNAQTERNVNRGLAVLPSRQHSLAGLGETAAANPMDGIMTAVKRTLMEKAALQTGVSIALSVAQAAPIVGQILAAVYGVVQALFSAKYKKELQEHLDAFNQWATAQGAAADQRLEKIQTDAWLKIRASAITTYTDAKANGINSSATLARTSPWWQDLVAKYSKQDAIAPAAGLGELFPTGKSGLAWVGDNEIIADTIRRRSYTGLAHIVDHRGSYYGTVWYDGRLLYPNNGLGDVWSSLKDSISDTYRMVSSKVVALVPKAANFIPPVAAIKYIVVPAMKEVGWEGSANKLESGVTAAGNVVAAVVIGGAASAFVSGAALTPVIAPNVISTIVTAQSDALIASQAIDLAKQPVVELISATGHDTAAQQAGQFLDKASDKGEQYASDPGVAITDTRTVIDTLTGKESVTQADEQIEKGKKTLLAALAQRESEAITQLNSETYQSTTAGMLTCKMLDDPAFAAQLLQMANVEQAQAKSSAGVLFAAAAAAGGLFLMHR